jgi:hypothetical protein
LELRDRKEAKDGKNCTVKSVIISALFNVIVVVKSRGMRWARMKEMSNGRKL